MLDSHMICCLRLTANLGQFHKLIDSMRNMTVPDNVAGDGFRPQSVSIASVIEAETS